MTGRNVYPIDLTRMEIKFEFGQPRPPHRKTSDKSLRVLITGDFTGRDNREGYEGKDSLSSRSIKSVSVDNFDAVLAHFSPKLQLELSSRSEAGINIEFRHLDDFHPDELYHKLDIFQELRETRTCLLDPSTFEITASELLGGTMPTIKTLQSSVKETESQSEEDEAAMLERLLGRQPVALSTPRPQVDVSHIVKRLIEPHISPVSKTDQDKYVASLDSAISDTMRSILHDPAFQSLESTWRSIHWLITNIETDQELKVFLLDASKQELADDIHSASKDLQDSQIYKLLVETSVQRPGAEPWSLLVGNYTFGNNNGDIATLAGLGFVASNAGGPFIAAAAPSILGCESVRDTPDPSAWKPCDAKLERYWTRLRRSSVAAWIGLALPRVLLRLPYGKHTDPIEEFQFEEMALARNHEDYLWGNPAFACARLVARALSAHGESSQKVDNLEIADLPAHIYLEDGESRLQPCAEVLLSDRAAEAISSRGLIPLLSYPNRNAIRLLRFQSLAAPPVALFGL
jgi:type VI secretion system protein ImpC